MSTAEKVLARERIGLNVSTGIMGLPETLMAKRPGGLPTNNQLDGYLRDGKKLPGVRSGTGIFYIAPGEAIGSQIRYHDLVFDVPRVYRGLRNVALIIEHPDFRIKKIGDLFVATGHAIGVTKNFPAADGWYLTDRFGIPQGERTSQDNPEARYLWRAKEGYGGAVVRGNDGTYVGDWRYVVASFSPDYSLRVASLACTGTDDLLRTKEG
jgi:hypothetical protein